MHVREQPLRLDARSQGAVHTHTYDETHFFATPARGARAGNL